jgi:2-hydroxychromene-2-carboxylate isomerase
MQLIPFYFDFISPFSYFAWIELNQTNEISLFALKPAPLASLLNHHGIKGPGEIDPKREYLFRFCLRYAEKNKIPFTPPKTHPFNPLYALRLSTREASGDLQWQVVDALWKGAWQLRLDMGDPNVIEQHLNQMGLPGAELIEKTFEREVKTALKKNTEEAISHGAFGVPSFVFQNELFWGRDSLEDLRLKIKGCDPLNYPLYEEMLKSTPRAASQTLAT